MTGLLNLLNDILDVCWEHMVNVDIIRAFIYMFFYMMVQGYVFFNKHFLERLPKRSTSAIVVLVLLFWPTILLRCFVEKTVEVIVKAVKHLRIAYKNIRRIIRKRRKASNRKLVMYSERK